MRPEIVFTIIAIYFGLLLLISYFTSRNATNKTFFNANKQSPWYLVAFGMIGALLSGVTFISVPGAVGNTAFSYFQIILGNLVGYTIIATVLLPLYYKLNLVSIYTYLEKRLGRYSFKTGALFFLISQTLGASLRLFLVAGVLQIGFFNAFNIPFWLTVLVTIALIWLYTFRAGIKTIVWTDTLQTFFMLLAVIVSIFIISDSLDLSLSQVIDTVKAHPYSETFFWDWQQTNYFPKHFLAGVFIALAMTGLDQNMMQKNLTCKTLKDAKTNMITFSWILVPVNLLFLSLGVLLYMYVEANGLSLTDTDTFHYSIEKAKFINTDDLFPLLALNNFSIFAGIVFLLGIIAAAFSSADSALTALTTSFCVDFLGIDGNGQKQKRIRQSVHIGFSLLMFLVIIIFKIINEASVIHAVFVFAAYTYGPLLGMFFFGLFTKREVKDKLVPFIAILSPMLTYLLSINSETLLWGYKFGYEIIIPNGLLMYGLMTLFSKKTSTS